MLAQEGILFIKILSDRKEMSIQLPELCSLAFKVQYLFHDHSPACNLLSILWTCFQHEFKEKKAAVQKEDMR